MKPPVMLKAMKNHVSGDISASKTKDPMMLVGILLTVPTIA